jgi:hypothetical protein
MRSLACFLCLFALSWGCASPTSDDTPVATPADAPGTLIGAYFAAVQDGDRAAALALGSEEWAARESEWSSGFTHAFFEQGVGVASWDLLGLNLEDEGVISARVRALLTREGEEPDNEGMRFSLQEMNGRWQIVDLK